MALQINKTFDSGILVNNGYLKVVTIQGNKELITYQARLATSKAYADENKFVEGFFITNRFVPIKDDFNYIAQAYSDIKSKLEFSNSIDV